MARQVVEFFATEEHYADHLRPVWQALPEEVRGPFVDEPPRRDATLGPVVVAAGKDLAVAARCRRPIVLLEHGAGQSYGNRHHSYAGGRGRDLVSLFVVPGPASADRNRRYYPSTPTVEVGSPRVDELRRIPPPTGSPTVAVSFHWRCLLNPEAGTALDDFAPELERARLELERAGVELIGHAHPRILDEAREIYLAAGIETVASFADVVARAHLYAVDNSSTLFEFAALERPVVVLNARAYRRSATWGLRFWSEADVGLNADPGELADVVLAALEDPPEVAGSRKAAVARTYALTDGTSADRAAAAIVSLLRKRSGCLVCGAAHSHCGPKTDVVAVDQQVRSQDPMRGEKKRFANPTRPGAFLVLTDADALRMGFDPADGIPRGARPAPAPDVTNEGADGPVTSAELAPPADPKPKGALAPGGPTSRSRKGKGTAEPADPDEELPPVATPTTSRRRRSVEG